MKRSRFVPAVLSVVLFALVTGCSGGEPAPSSATPTTSGPALPSLVNLTEADDGAAVLLATGGTLVVTLESNASTGFAWAVEGEPPLPLEMQGDPQYVEPEGGLVGAPGTQVFTFVAVAAGEGTLSLAYAREWETDTAPESTFTVSVAVE